MPWITCTLSWDSTGRPGCSCLADPCPTAPPSAIPREAAHRGPQRKPCNGGLPRAVGSLSNPSSDQPSGVHRCLGGDLGEDCMGLTFLPEPLQPHSQFLSMFRYQFRGPLGGAGWEIKRGKLLGDVCATDPTSNQLSIEPVFPGRAKILAGGREHSPGVMPWCPIACQALWSTAWCRHGLGLRADTL